jgi:hypothetical protein
LSGYWLAAKQCLALKLKVRTLDEMFKKDKAFEDQMNCQFPRVS